MARKQADDYGSKQSSILESAAIVIAECGMSNASMAQIAERGNVSKALLYHYYPSKAALIFDIVQTHLSELNSSLEQIDTPNAPPEERLERLILCVLEIYQDSDNQHKVQLNCMGTLTPEQMDSMRELERQITRRFSDVIQLINPELSKDSPLLMPTTMSLFGMLNWAYLWFRKDGPLGREDYAQLVTRLMLNGMKGL